MMCQRCLDALNELFPEVPAQERFNFLMCCTAFPAGDGDMVREQLINLRAKTTDWRECFAIAEREDEQAYERYLASQNQGDNAQVPGES